MDKKKIFRLGYLFLWAGSINAINFAILFLSVKLLEKPLLQDIYEQNPNATFDGPDIFVLLMAASLIIGLFIAITITTFITLITIYLRKEKFSKIDFIFFIILPLILPSLFLMIMQFRIGIITLGIQILLLSIYKKIKIK